MAKDLKVVSKQIGLELNGKMITIDGGKESVLSNLKKNDKIKLLKLNEKGYEDLVAFKDGEALVINYADGSTIRIDGFYTLDNVSLELPVAKNEVHLLTSSANVNSSTSVVYGQGNVAQFDAMYSGKDSFVTALHDYSGGSSSIAGMSTTTVVAGAAALVGVAALAASGGGSSSSSPAPIVTPTTTETGHLVDSPIVGATYERYDANGKLVGTGTTGEGGSFVFNEGETIVFKVGSVTLGDIKASDMPADGNVMPQDIIGVARDLSGATADQVAKVTQLAIFLQTLDAVGTAADGNITIDANSLKLIDTTKTGINFKDGATAEEALNETAVTDAGKTVVTKDDAIAHLEDSTPETLTDEAPVVSGDAKLGNFTENNATITTTGIVSDLIASIVTDREADTLSIVDGTYKGTYGTLVILDGVYTYTIAASSQTIADGSVVNDTIALKVTDGTNDSDINFTASITGVDALPVITSLSTAAAIDENSGAGQVVYKVTATDMDSSVIAYSLSGADAGLFTINSSGEVTLIDNPNFEAKSSYKFTVEANDGVLTNSKAVTLAINNVNEAPVANTEIVREFKGYEDGPVIFSKSLLLNGIADAESILSASSITSISVDKGTLTTSGSSYVFKAPANEFGDYTVTYKVTDGKNEVEFKATIKVASVDDKATSTDGTITINEDESIVHSTLTGLLPDAIDPEGESVVYSLGKEAANGTVTVNADGTFDYTPDANFVGTDTFTFKVTTATSIDATNKLDYIFVIDDTGSMGGTIDTVKNTIATFVDELVATGIDAQFGFVRYGEHKEGASTFSGFYTAETLSAFQASLRSVSASGGGDFPESGLEALMTVASQDFRADAGHKVMLLTDATSKSTEEGYTPPEANYNADQVIKALVAKNIKVDIAAGPYAGDLDYEQISSATGGGVFALNNSTIFTTDSTAFESYYTMTITVTAVNDAPIITSSETATAINENSGAEQVVYTVTASDVDRSDTVTYSLSGADAALFTINSLGEVVLTEDPNFENKSSYEFTVVASDGTLTDTQNVTLAINNVNEAPAIISSETVESLDENMGAGYVVYTVEAVDIDSSVTYSLGGIDAALFTIDSSTGEVRLIADPNFENKSSYAFTVVASDGTSTDTRELTLSINNLVEGPAVTTSQTSVVRLSGEIDAGDKYELTINGVTKTYIANGTEDLSTIAGILAGQMNADIAVNASVVLVATGATISVTVAEDALSNTFTISTVSTNGVGGVDDSVATLSTSSAIKIATINLGTATYQVGDVVTVKVNGIDYSHRVEFGNETNAQIATALAALIDPTSTPNSRVDAISDGSTITITGINGIPFTVESSVANIVYHENTNPTPLSVDGFEAVAQVSTINIGSVPYYKGDVINVTVEGVEVNYTVTGAELNLITSLVSEINAQLSSSLSVVISGIEAAVGVSENSLTLTGRPADRFMVYTSSIEAEVTNNSINNSTQIIDTTPAITADAGIAKVVSVSFADQTVTAGEVYSVTLQDAVDTVSTTFTYTAVAGNTMAYVLNKLVDQINSSTTVDVSAKRSGSNIFITADYVANNFDVISALDNLDSAVITVLNANVPATSAQAQTTTVNLGLTSYDVGDVVKVTVDGAEYSTTVTDGQTNAQIAAALASNISGATSHNEVITITGLLGVSFIVNATVDNVANVANVPVDAIITHALPAIPQVVTIDLNGQTYDAGDVITVNVAGTDYSYPVNVDNNGITDTSASIAQELVAAIGINTVFTAIALNGVITLTGPANGTTATVTSSVTDFALHTTVLSDPTVVEGEASTGSGISSMVLTYDGSTPVVEGYTYTVDVLMIQPSSYTLSWPFVYTARAGDTASVSQLVSSIATYITSEIVAIANNSSLPAEQAFYNDFIVSANGLELTISHPDSGTGIFWNGFGNQIADLTRYPAIGTPAIAQTVTYDLSEQIFDAGDIINVTVNGGTPDRVIATHKVIGNENFDDIVFDINSQLSSTGVTATVIQGGNSDGDLLLTGANTGASFTYALSVTEVALSDNTVTKAVAQESSVVFTTGTHEAGDVYSVHIGSLTASYTTVGDETINDITATLKDALYNLTENYTITVGESVIGSGNFDTISVLENTPTGFTLTADVENRPAAAHSNVDSALSDDTINISGITNNSIDDLSTGNDTLVLDNNVSLDLGVLLHNNNVHLLNLENIDLSKGSSSLINITADEVFAITTDIPGANQLNIINQSNDTITLAAQWTVSTTDPKVYNAITTNNEEVTIHLTTDLSVIPA